MTSTAILPHPIRPIAELPIDGDLADALLSSMSEYAARLHGRRLWLACSGGRDSLALAALCVQLYHHGKLPCLPQLLHVDHGLQNDSQHWARHVADWAKAQQIPCHILAANVVGHDEQAARQARYAAMRAHVNQGDVLLLAHHADDQAETVLMRLIQGAGIKGLAGIQPWRTQNSSGQQSILWRPWLTIRRTTISRYATRLALPYIDDPTNDTGDNVRSGLRRDIMPILTMYNPNVIDNIARSAQLLKDAETTVSAQAVQDMQQTTIPDLNLPAAQQVLDIKALQALPIPRQGQLLHYWLGQNEPLPPAKQLVDDVCRLTQRHDHDHQTALFWQGGKQAYTIRRYRECLYRLSHSWLDWLSLPMIHQPQRVSLCAAYGDTTAHSAPTSSKTISVILRSNESYTWQLQIAVDTLAPCLRRYLNDPDTQATLTIAPLERTQHIQTAWATRPQSGKKLYQTLGIPSWLRESLVVVSVVVSIADAVNESQTIKDRPILLISPFASCILGAEQSNIDDKNQSLVSQIQSVVRLNKAL